MDNLRTLEQHITYIKEYGLLDSNATRAEVWPKIEDAVAKVSTRLQVHISKRLQQLQVENTNIGLVQQAIASSCGFANFFVGQHSEEMYAAICSEYKETMSKVYLVHAKSHMKELQKIEGANTSRGLKKPEMHVIIPKDFFDVKKGKESGEKKFSLDKLTGMANQIKTLGRKGFDIELKDRTHSLCAVEVVKGQIFLDPSILDKGKQTHTWCDTLLQALFRVANQMITEKTFVSAFFEGSNKKEDLIAGAFGKAFAFLSEFLRKALDEYPLDVCGAIIAARGIDIVETYFSTNHDVVGNRYIDTQLKEWSEILKNRVLHLMSVNLRTVKDINLVPLQPHRFHIKHTIVEAIGTDAALAAQLTLHSVVLRYAEFSADIHALNTMQIKYSRVAPVEVSSPPGTTTTFVRRPIFEDYIQTSLSTILLEMRKLITSLARRHANVTLQNIFYITNYSGVLETWNEGGVPGDVSDYTEVTRIQAEIVDQFVLQEFQSSMFGKILDFVNKYEPLVQLVKDTGESTEGGAAAAIYQANQEIVNAQEMQTLVMNFHKSWQQGLAALHEAVGKYFSSPSITTTVLRAFFLRILDVNQRMRVLILSCFANPPFRSKLVSNQNIMHEITARYVIQME
jgi:hypothetical protein